MALKVGDKAPGFVLNDSYEKEVSLSDFKGKRVIIYFYPKDNTPGCTKEACNFKENWDLLQKNNSNSYVNPHNYPGKWVAQEYLPKALRGLKIWEPNNFGWEKIKFEELQKRKKS